MTVPLARRNIFNHLGKLMLSTLSIVAAITLILLLVGLRAGLYASLTAFIEHVGAELIVAQSGVQGMFSSDSSVPVDIHDELVQVTNAIDGGHILVSDVIFTIENIKTPVILIGYETKSQYGSPWSLGAGRYIDGENQIMLDTWLAQRNELDVGSKIEFLGKEFEVVGLTLGTSSWMSPYIFISLTDAENVLVSTGLVSYHLLSFSEDQNIVEAQNLINSEFSNLEALTPDEIALADRRVVATIMDLPISVLLSISVFVGATVMGLTAYTSISDRIKEYGVLKAIGASQSWLRLVVIKEMLYQSVISYFLAIGAAFLVANMIMGLYPQFNILIESEVIIKAGGLTIVMTIFSALIPLQKLKRVDPMSVFKS